MKNFLTSDIETVSGDQGWRSFTKVYRNGKTSNVRIWLWGILIVLILVLFLPWTQNIRAKGTVTTLRQEQRPQELNTVLPGKIIKWHVKEGDYVKKGDTILQLGEIKVEYFDTSLLLRTREQINAKEKSKQEYLNKTQTGATQIMALTESLKLKLEAVDNKLQQQQLKNSSDSMEIIAVNNELQIYKRQIDAAKLMLDSGAISLTEFEKRKVNYQNSIAKKTSIENKLLQGRQELQNLRIEKNGAQQDFNDKAAKAEGERFGSLSAAASTDAEVSKLENAYANYNVRNGLYYIRAPQDGQVIKAKKSGIGEMVKEGEMIVEIVPADFQFAVELFVDPMDLPLISIGQKVRFVFDGFPAIVFSGWPKSSYGTFSGIIAAIETSLGNNGKFRVLVTEDINDRKWPVQLKLGGGANGIALLKDVPIYYELWRNINGFPPEYYQINQTTKMKESK